MIDYTGKLGTVRDLIGENARITEAFLDYGLKFYGVSNQEL